MTVRSSVSGVDVQYRNISLQQHFAEVALNACAIVSDLGKHEAIVMWPADLIGRGSLSGFHHCILTFNATRTDNNRHVTAKDNVGRLKTFQLIVNG